ncbi:MAG: hypothetical protein PHR26_01280 [Candidatus ainarchaeum sp.]|nr:hypothetical protein [Candidatus ainarchaeum sp.]MDD3975843.1 hypothetical protein [Candidatus ainarchaeum sp.]
MLEIKENKKINKKMLIIIIIVLIIGFILGLLVSNNIDLDTSCKSEKQEIDILNKEINSCINSLNNYDTIKIEQGN